MENALPHNKAEQSTLTTGAPIIAAGGLPAKLATVTSEVLARLLSGERLTGLEAVHDASTTRLALRSSITLKLRMAGQ